MTCTHCNNGQFNDTDIMCISGVLIDVDEFTEGWQRDIAYPPAPCMCCRVCKGAAWNGEEECGACGSTGWNGGRDLSQEALADHAAREPGREGE